MSVSRSGPGDVAENWDDLDKVQVEQTARISDAASNQGYARQLPAIDTQRSDTLSLSNDEVAELVALDINGFRAYVDNNNYGGTYNFRHAMSVALNYDDMGWLRSNDLETDNVGTSGEMAGRTRIEDRGNILWWGADSYTVAVEATGSGAGALDSPGDDTRTINFREGFGRGPMIDNNDNFTHGAFVRTVNVATNTNIVQILDWTGHFDIFETERIYR